MNHEIQSGQPPNNPEAPKPTIRDLQEHAPTGKWEKAFARYFIPDDYENSIKWHERLGTPFVRKLTMDFIGILYTPEVGANQRLERNLPRIEAETDFMLKGSVLNELLHTGGILLSTARIYSQQSKEIEKKNPLDTYFTLFSASMLTLHLGLLAVQRYNRAKLVKSINERFKNGETYSDEYENYLGIDAQAVRNFQAKQAEDRLAKEGKTDTQEITIFPDKDEKPIQKEPKIKEA